MTQFFADESQVNIDERKVLITGDDFNHIKNVLRMKPGEEFSVRTQGSGREIRCAVSEFTDDTVICEIRFIKEDNTELPVSVTVYQALPKADKMETVITKCTELGAVRFVPVRTSRCVVKLDDKKASSKCTRWQQIAESAAKQSQRGIIPEVAPVMDLDEALADSEKCNIRLIPYELAGDMEGTRKIFAGIKPQDKVAVFIGPEGGFDEREVAQAKDKGFVPITLGRRILRTETAAMTVMGWFTYLFDDKA